jgi:rhomboid protease GluP
VVPVATFGLLAVMLATYLFYELRDGASLQAALEAGGMWPPLVAAGDWWRLFTSTWLHASWTHLLMNAFGLLVLGPFVERSLGVPRYLAVYLLAAVGGNVALFAFMQAGVVPMHPVVGASGGIMGIFGAWAAVLLLGWRERRARVALRRLVVLSAILVLQILFDVTTPQVSFAAHALGLVIGLATTLIAGRGRS